MAPLSYNPLPTSAQAFLLPDPSNPTGVNFRQLLTGWDPCAAANATAYGVTSPLTLNNRYGLPFLFQTRRTMPMGLKFVF